MQLIADFVPNHTSPLNSGEHGVLFDGGKAFATPQDHPDYFHIAPTISDWNDSDQLQHRTIFDLADLNQDNPTVSAYLLDSARLLQRHGVDAFRIDSMKHVNWNWLPRLVRAVKENKPDCFVFGEWFQGSTGEPRYADSATTANQAGMSVVDYPLAMAMRAVFGADNADFKLLSETLARENRDFAQPDQLVTFIDNHDISRFLNIQPERNKLHLALVCLMTTRGIPCIYYGTEQYLYDATGGGKDPYDRPMMRSFSEETGAFKLISWLCDLRTHHPAIYNGSTQWLVTEKDCAVYERGHGRDRVYVALNKDADDVACFTNGGRCGESPA
jgi:glycosidase